MTVGLQNSLYVWHLHRDACQPGQKYQHILPLTLGNRRMSPCEWKWVGFDSPLSLISLESFLVGFYCFFFFFPYRRKGIFKVKRWAVTTRMVSFRSHWMAGLGLQSRGNIYPATRYGVRSQCSLSGVPVAAMHVGNGILILTALLSSVTHRTWLHFEGWFWEHCAQTLRSLVTSWQASYLTYSACLRACRRTPVCI